MNKEQKDILEKVWDRCLEFRAKSNQLIKKSDSHCSNYACGYLKLEARKLYAEASHCYSQAELIWYEALLEYAKSLSDLAKFIYSWDDGNCIVDGVIFYSYEKVWLIKEMEKE